VSEWMLEGPNQSISCMAALTL